MEELRSEDYKPMTDAEKAEVRAEIASLSGDDLRKRHDDQEDYVWHMHHYTQQTDDPTVLYMEELQEYALEALKTELERRGLAPEEKE